MIRNLNFLKNLKMMDFVKTTLLNSLDEEIKFKELQCIEKTTLNNRTKTNTS